MKIGDCSEFDLIALIGDLVYRPSTVYKAIGDDCAVLPFSDEAYQLITCDLLLEGTHFLLGSTSYYQLGYKAVAASLSDIAAMGGQPTHILLALGLPSSMEIGHWQAFYQGVGAICRKYGVNVIGGDTTRSQQGLVVNITAMGLVDKSLLRLRSQAKIGDQVFITGPLGASLGGLTLILKPEILCHPDQSTYLRQKHNQPEPCCQEIAWLNQVAGDQLHALNDISDGLASECREIAQASQVGIMLYQGKIPIDPAAALLAQQLGEDPQIWGLTSGEEYQLVGTIAGSAFADLEQAYYKLTGQKIYGIGEVVDQAGLYWKNDQYLEPLQEKGYNHFKQN